MKQNQNETIELKESLAKKQTRIDQLETQVETMAIQGMLVICTQNVLNVLKFNFSSNFEKQSETENIDECIGFLSNGFK